jgi:CubicO group peptidase (beta-lactamase class C family)
MKNRRISIAPVCLILTSGLAAAQDLPAAEVELARRIEETVRREVPKGFSGAVYVQHHGVVLVDGGYGTVAGTTLGSTSRFRLGTLGDPFTAAAVLKCSVEAPFSLDDPLARFLPDAPADKKKITVRQLLLHRSGLPPASPAEGVESRDEAVTRVLARPSTAGAGQGVRHSGDNYLLAAAIVEIACRSDLASFIRKELLEPSGMSDTGLIGLKDEDDRTIAPLLRELPAHLTGRSWDQPRYYSTTRDLATWFGAIRSGRLLPRAGVIEFAGASETPGLGGFAEDDERGLRRQSSTGGEDSGANGAIHVYPNSDTIVVVLTHAGDKADGLGWASAIHAGIERVLFP